MQKHVWMSFALSSVVALAAACGSTTVVTEPAGPTNPDEAGAADAGLPSETDACTGDACDAGPVAPADAGPLFSMPTVCTSATMWTRGDHGSSQMHPGGACVSCHADNGGPTLVVGGTVYPTGHEPDDCNGISATGTTIVITDKNNNVTTVPVNAVGNFYTSATIATPFHAKVVKGGVERAMVAAQTSGDCNSCHTVAGTKSAPGRIVAP